MSKTCKPWLRTAHFLVISIVIPSQASGQFSTQTLGRNVNEPSLVLSPQKPAQAIIATNINRIFHFDESTQKYRGYETTSSLGVYGDPVLHYAGDTLFYAHLSKTPHKPYGDWFERIVVQKIHRINPWEETSYSVGYNPPKMQDKPWLSSDNHSKNYKGNVYVTWTEFDQYGSKDTNHFSRIRFSSYHTSRDSFIPPITISDTVGDCVDSDNTLEGATTAVGKKGELYATWSGHSKIWFDKSFDGGETWGKDQVIAQQLAGWDMELPHIMRANGMPFLACDTVRDILYVTWADEKEGNTNVWLIYSENKGDVWSKPILISKQIGNQYFPNITVDPSSGNIYVAYYDQQYSSSNRFYDITLTQINVHDSARYYSYRISPQSIPLPGKDIFFGDYLDIDYNENYLALAYTSYDQENTTVQLFISPTNQLKSNTPNTRPFSHSFLNINDTTEWTLNVQKPLTISYKIQTRKGLKYSKQRNQRTYHPENTNRDYIIAKIPPEGNTRIKYTISVQNDNGEKLIYKGRKILVISN